MQSISSGAAGILRESHRFYVSADLYRAGVIVATDLRPVAGTVTLDGTADHRGTMTGVVFAAADAFDVVNQINQLDADLQLWRGVYLADGTVERWGIGRYRVDTCERELLGSDGRSIVTVAGVDTSVRVSDAGFIVPASFTAGTNYATAIAAIVGPRVNFAINYLLSSTAYTTPSLVFTQGQDPWRDAALSMADSVGWRLYFDGIGQLVGTPVNDPQTQDPVWSFEDGVAATVIDRRPVKSRQGVYSAAISSGQTSGATAPVQAVVYDLDPTSPTYFYGGFGQVPIFESSQFVVTQAQANAAAAALLLRSRGITERASISAVPAPHLEPGDVISLTSNGAQVLHAITSVTVPLDNDAMRLETRSR
jgi:hypothetical protein